MVSWTKSANELIKQLDEVITSTGACAECGSAYVPQPGAVANETAHYTWCSSHLVASILSETPVTQADLDYVKQSLGL